MRDGGTAATAGAEQSLAERLFLCFAFLVLQGAFVGLASSAETGDVASGTDLPHMLAFLLLVLGTVFFAHKHLDELFRGVAANVAFFVLPSILIVSAIWSVEPSLTLKRSILALAVCGFDLYVATKVGLDRLLKLLSITIFIAAVASAVVAIAVPNLGREISEGLIGDWRGVFPQKNALGQVISVGVFIEMALMIRAHRILLWSVVKIGLLTLLLAMAGSASSILSALLTIVVSVIYVSYRQGAVGIVLCGLVMVAIAVLLGSIAASDINFLFGALDRDATLTGRTELWVYVERAIQERPLLGWGYEAFWTPDSNNMTYIQNQIHWGVPNSHNGYLELTLALGFVGVGGLAIMVLWALKRIFLLVRKRDDLGAMLLIVTIQFLDANFTESSMINGSVFIWNVFAIFGLKAGIALRQRPIMSGRGFQSVPILKRAKPRPSSGPS